MESISRKYDSFAYRTGTDELTYPESRFMDILMEFAESVGRDDIHDDADYNSAMNKLMEMVR